MRQSKYTYEILSPIARESRSIAEVLRRLGPIGYGRPLTLHLDHINGIRNDNRLENLRFLCPNCHQQTETWGVKCRHADVV